MIYDPSGEKDDKGGVENNDPKDVEGSKNKNNMSTSDMSTQNFLNMYKQDIVNVKISNVNLLTVDTSRKVNG